MREAVLEFKAKDGAWYAGTATFEGPFLRVHFEHFADEEDERWLPTKFKSPQDVKKMIRPASQPMQDFQCSSLRRGIFLCVACRQPGSDCFEYYDAKLQQIRRSPHKVDRGGQECCMCQFEVEWLGGPLVQKKQFVTCGDICLKTPGDIEDDPVIKDYLAEVKCGKVQKGKDASEKDILLTSKKRKVASSVDERGEQASSAKCEQSVSKNDSKGLDTSLQCGESSNHFRDYGIKKEGNLEGQPLKKICLSTQFTKSSEPPILSHNLPDLNKSAKGSVDFIEIDSDKEEDCKPSSRVSHTQTGAVNDTLVHKSVEGSDCSKRDNKGNPHKASPSLVDGFSTRHDFSGISNEQMFSCTGDGPACSYVALPRRRFKGEPYQCEAVGFIPVAPVHLTNMCTHSMCSHRNANISCKWTRSGDICPHSTTSQVCGQNAHFQADIPTQKQHFEDNGDVKEISRAQKENTREYFCLSEKGISHTQFLLVENIEKDVIPSKALKAIRKVTCDALMIYIWPSLDYETTRKGYICYQDFEAAETAYQKLCAENIFIVSSKGRPWIVSHTPLHKLDWMQMYSISAAIALKEDDLDEDKAAAEGDLFIWHKGTEEYTIARGKQKLFWEQQKVLRRQLQQFSAEERDLETLT
ncbi:hypothetical protein GOP47_0020791 [Adiantum capillus-veneris]|uniref:SAWADEE domain-containing protein n=1 Tax=Adiantum capillus-veneris TaxID=13818 RepID=A0A9D4Z913_ADICA|nr:hypothetical protein GOP47_0020791 [Adiantum capillus-veneris]